MNDMTPPSTDTSCGFVSVIGLPNAGKSTLINQLVGQKITIVSHKVQTTRSRVLGIVTHDKAQVILVDTPGIFDAKKTMERAMVTAAYDAIDQSDMAMHLVDASTKNPLDNNRDLIKRLPQNKPCFLILNKTDQAKKEDLLALSQKLNDEFDYKATFMISALKGHGTQDLAAALSDAMPEGEWLFDEDQVTDTPMRLLAAEITREKIFNRLYRELPVSTFVETESWEEFDNGSVKINQLIYVQRDSQKAIVLGKQGRQIKKIGQEAREELEDLFERRIHLKLFVKVKEDWTEQPEMLRLMGLVE
jgi:GTP-binding protein Era